MMADNVRFGAPEGPTQILHNSLRSGVDIWQSAL